MPRLVKSIEGISPYQVFQRNESNQGSVSFRGTLTRSINGVLEARIRKGASVVIDWHGVGKTSGTAFEGQIAGIPVGGEYTAELRFAGGEVFAIPHLLVGDLWILAGQSNMDGYGKLVNLETPLSTVHCFYMDDSWGIAKDPLCGLLTSVDPVHWADVPNREEAIEWERNFRNAGAGLGVRFGKDLYHATGVPVGLIPCSHGGTCMDQWDPALKGEGGNSLYGAMIRRVEALGGKVAGCLWYQGESDGQPNTSGAYKEKFRSFIQVLRKDLGQPDLPFIYAQIAVLYGDPNHIADWNVIQWAQSDLEKEVPNAAMAATVDLSMSDVIHLDAVGQRKLGARMALLARILRFGDKSIAPGPRAAEFTPGSDRMSLTIGFKGVNGAFKQVPKVFGFEIESEGLVPIKSTRIEGNRVTLYFTRPMGVGAKLWHGRGHSPVVNLVDAAGLALPVFGPVEIS